MLVEELAETIAVTPLNLTVLLAGTGSKLAPVIVTTVPTAPVSGATLLIEIIAVLL